METEKLVAIILVVVVVGGLSAFLFVNYGDTIFDVKPTVEIGDCVNVSYILYLVDENGEKVIPAYDYSYGDVDNKTGGYPVPAFVTYNKSEESPEGYEYYMPMIEGFTEGIIGLKEGDEVEIGPIPPEKAYGDNKLAEGDTFVTGNLAYGLNQTVEVTELTNASISLKWIDVESIDKFTMPQMVFKNLSTMDTNEMIIVPPPFYLWEDSTEIVEIKDNEVVTRTTPTSSENILDSIEQVQYGTGDADLTYVFPDATTVTWDETTVTFNHSPEEGKEYPYSLEYYGETLNIIFTVENVTDEIINVSTVYEGSEEKTYQEIATTLTFDRNFTLPRMYNDIPSMYQVYIFGEDLENAGYSAHELAGETLFFEVKIEEIHKTSQEES